MIYRITPKIGLVLCGMILFFCSCKHNPSPKPRGYFRMEFPTDTQRIIFQNPGWPYGFKTASFSEVEPVQQAKGQEYWCNVNYPQINATLYISYKTLSLSKGNTLADRIEETYQLSYKHAVKADYINETNFAIAPNKVYGSLYEVGGDAASAIQFYATDSVHHFIRGALYFNCTPKRDSLAPAIEFLTKDIHKIVESIRWY